MTRSELKSIDQLKKYSRLTLSSHKSTVHSVRWNPEGDILASGGEDRMICLHRLAEGRVVPETKYLNGHTDDIDQVCWNPIDTYQLASSSVDKHVKVWDVRIADSIGSTKLRNEIVTACWSNDGNTIAATDKTDVISFIDTRTGYKVIKDHKFQIEIGDITWNKSSDMFFVTSGDGNVHVLSYPDLQTLLVIDAHSSPCICMRFDPSGKHFAIGSNDAIVSVWDTENLACTRVLDRLDWPTKSLCFSFDGKYIAMGSEDSFIDIAEVSSGQQVGSIDVNFPTLTLDFHPKDYMLAYALRAENSRPDPRDPRESREYREVGAIKISGMPEDPKKLASYR